MSNRQALIPRPYKGRHRRRRQRPLLVTLAATIAALFAIGCGGAATPDGPVDPNPPAVREATANPPKGNPPASTVVGDGQHAVGEDIKAGTYTTTVPADAFGCYWARLRNFDGELNSIIANDNLAAGAKGRVVVKKSDAGVELSGGCEWKRAAK